MSERGGQGDGGGWLVLAGGCAAIALYAACAASRNRKQPAGAAGAHAWLVPTDRSRTEAEWTRRALGHASESKA